MSMKPTMTQIPDILNIYGLIVIGLCLIVGAFSKLAKLGAMGLLAMYYLSHPPLLDVNYILRPEGSYLWIDKNTIAFFALVVLLYFPTSKQIGLDRYIFKLKKER